VTKQQIKVRRQKVSITTYYPTDEDVHLIIINKKIKF